GTTPFIDTLISTTANCTYDFAFSPINNSGWVNVEISCDGGINWTWDSLGFSAAPVDSLVINFNGGGLITDCLGVPGGPNMPGTPCSDNNPNTINDTWTPGCACVGVPLPPTCQASFTISNSSPWVMNLDNTSTGMAPMLYDWYLPDGSSSAQNSLYFVFTTPGTYGVCLTIVTWDNCTSTICDTVYVDSNGTVATTPAFYDCFGYPNGPNLPGTPCSDNNPNTINDTWSPTCTCVGTPLPPNCQADFGIWQPSTWVMGLSNASTGMGPLVFNWYLPDGSTSNSSSPTYTFTAPGTYGVCLTITPADACTSTLCDTVFVDTAGVITQAPYYYDCLGVPNGPAVQGTPCQIPGTILQGAWDLNCVCDTTNVLLFDCLNYLNGPNMPGTPCNDGDTLTVQDTWSMSCACVGVPVNYYDCMGVLNGPDLPGAPCNDNDPLTVNDTWDANCACTGGVLQPCNADFWVLQAYTIDSLNSVPVPTPYELWIWNLSSGGSGVYSFFWNFGDGSSSTDAFPTHTYAGNGPYNLCLTISDTTGCQSTYCDSVSIDGNGLYTGMLGVGSDRQNGFTINVKIPQINGVTDAVLAEGIATWPNPATDELNIALTNALSGTADVTVMDLEGRMVMAERHMLANGRNQLLLRTATLSPGMYVVRIGNGTSFISQRFVKTN
ncbi:MAG: T9SS type A sorting domain-containing protein, partial [Flavobacteriales bacterium]|nr:T9SS type A sorting domain-containing protein [Flavobacteriales bacterium]